MTDQESVLPAVTDIARESGDVGIVRSQDFVSQEPFKFDCGTEMPEFTLRYETYGKLNAAGANAIFICHALSGDHHCAGPPFARRPQAGLVGQYHRPRQAVRHAGVFHHLRQLPWRVPRLHRADLAQSALGQALQPRFPGVDHSRHGPRPRALGGLPRCQEPRSRCRRLHGLG